jgi:hypothetical protein
MFRHSAPVFSVTSKPKDEIEIEDDPGMFGCPVEGLIVNPGGVFLNAILFESYTVEVTALKNSHAFVDVLILNPSHTLSLLHAAAHSSSMKFV